MLILIKNNFFTLSNEDDEVLYDIYDTLTFEDFSKAYAGGRFDKDKIKKVRFAKFLEDVEIPTIKIPIGFLYFIKKIFKEQDLKIVDERKKLSDVDINVDLKDIQLRDHQKDAIKKALSKDRGIIRAPTGSGKTEVFLAIMKILNNESLVLFNRVNLAQQTLDRAKRRGLDAGIVQGNNVLEKKITMATVQSIEKIDDIKKYKNLIIDEVHYGSSDSYQQIMRMSHWERIYGFSATPVNPNKMDLKSAKIISHVGPVIFDVEAKPLIEKGIIAKPHIYFVKVNQPDDIEDFDYVNAEKFGITFNEHRNKIIKKITDDNCDRNVLILSKYIKQGENIHELIEDSKFVYNQTKAKDRLDILSDFESSKFRVLIAARIFDFGIDIINVDTLIIASGGKEFYLPIQRLGRALRASKDKKTVNVYDFWDETNEKLLRHSKSRKKAYINFGYDQIEIINYE
jgi:superfamily II DNA or RNA helicase